MENGKTRKWVIAAMLLGLLMASLDNTIISASIDKVIGDLNGFEQVSWVFTAYMLAATSTMLIFGKLSDLFGRKLFYLIGISLFLIGSVLCGVAQNMDQLIVFRAIQGIGSGALMPISFAIIFTIFNDPKTAGKLSGLFGAVFGLSSVLGPQLGSFITEQFTWRWCFYINLPIGILSFLILIFALKESKAKHKPSIDYVGAILLIIATISTLLAFEWGGREYDWDSLVIIGLLGLGCLTTFLFIYVEKRVKEPLLPMSIFKNKMVSITSLIVFCQGALMFSAISYIPLFATGVLGYKNANSALTPMMFSVMAGATISGIILMKFKIRTFYVFVMFFGVISSYLLTQIPMDASKMHLVLLMMMVGLFGIGPLMSVAQNAVASNLSDRMMGIGNSVVSFWRNIGGIFGAAITATIVNQHLHESLSEKMKGIPIPKEQLKEMAKPEVLMKATNKIPQEILVTLRQSLGEAINHGFYFALAMCLIGFVLALFVGNQKIEPKSKK